MSDVSDDTNQDVIQGLFWVTTDDICVWRRNGTELKASVKIIVLTLVNINKDFAHGGIRKHAEVSEVCITHFYSNIIAVKF